MAETQLEEAAQLNVSISGDRSLTGEVVDLQVGVNDISKTSRSVILRNDLKCYRERKYQKVIKYNK